MKYKQGDKVYCIRSYYDDIFNYNYKGKFYTIYKVRDNIIDISTEENSFFINSFILKNDNDFNPFEYNLFSDYFYTLKEYRVKKIQTLNKLPGK